MQPSLCKLALKSNCGLLSHYSSRLVYRRRKLSHPGHSYHCRRLTSGTASNESIKGWQHFILDNTEVSRNHLTPEMALRLITPACRLWSLPYDSECEESAGVADPYWAFYWPGGQALTRYLLDNPSVVSGKCVLDIGSGCGASAIASVMCGATRVLANDIDPVSVEAIKMNAALNQITLETSTDNLIGSHSKNWDVVLLGDMFYDKDFTNVIHDWLKYLASCQTNVLIGDPGRIYLQNHPIKRQLRQVFGVELTNQSKSENNGLTQGFVWQLI